MKTNHLLFFALLPLIIAGYLQAAPPGALAVNISAFDTMKFSLNKIEAQPGQTITVTLTNQGNLPKTVVAHDWVLLNAGTDPNAYSRLAVNAKDDDYQPKALASHVIASIPLLGPHESGSVTFTAPSTPGSYPFLCSFPAHCGGGMNGVLIVK
jgi:azurin